MLRLAVLAQGREDINSWLDQHPAVLGLIFLTIGILVGGWGLYELATGTAYSKRGKAMTGGSAKFLAITRIVVGVGCMLFAAYKLVLG